MSKELPDNQDLEGIFESIDAEFRQALFEAKILSAVKSFKPFMFPRRTTIKEEAEDFIDHYDEWLNQSLPQTLSPLDRKLLLMTTPEEIARFAEQETEKHLAEAKCSATDIASDHRQVANYWGRVEETVWMASYIVRRQGAII